MHVTRLADESFIVTAASDGTIRCGFATSLIGWRSDLLLQLFSMTVSTSRVAIDGGDNSRNAVYRELRVSFQKGDDGFKVIPIGANSSIDEFTSSNRVAFHCVDMVGLIPTSGSSTTSSSNEVFRTTQLVAYGGAAGLLRVHALNPVQYLR